MDDSIVRAVDGRRLLELGYGGFSRVVEPHAYGVDRKGDEVLLCWQVSGGSGSGERTGWKLLKLREAASVTALRTDFVVREGFAAEPPRAIATLYARVPAATGA